MESCLTFNASRRSQALDKVDLSTREDFGQLSLWQNECEGMCGV